MSREAFEKWWTEQYSAHRLNQIQSIGGDLTGIYVDPRAERSWQAWQAAQAQAQAPEPVAVADKGVLNWIDGKQFEHEADLYTQPAVNQQLLEAIEIAIECLELHGDRFSDLGAMTVLQDFVAAIEAAQSQEQK